MFDKHRRDKPGGKCPCFERIAHTKESHKNKRKPNEMRNDQKKNPDSLFKEEGFFLSFFVFFHFSTRRRANIIRGIFFFLVFLLFVFQRRELHCESNATNCFSVCCRESTHTHTQEEEEEEGVRSPLSLSFYIVLWNDATNSDSSASPRCRLPPPPPPAAAAPAPPPPPLPSPPPPPVEEGGAPLPTSIALQSNVCGPSSA